MKKKLIIVGLIIEIIAIVIVIVILAIKIFDDGKSGIYTLSSVIITFPSDFSLEIIPGAVPKTETELATWKNNFYDDLVEAGINSMYADFVIEQYLEHNEYPKVTISGTKLTKNDKTYKF